MIQLRQAYKQAARDAQFSILRHPPESMAHVSGIAQRIISAA